MNLVPGRQQPPYEQAADEAGTSDERYSHHSGGLAAIARRLKRPSRWCRPAPSPPGVAGAAPSAGWDGPRGDTIGFGAIEAGPD